MIRTTAFAFAAMAGLALSGCNPIANLQEAEKQIDRYQAHYSANELGNMYAMTGTKFRETSSLGEFEEFATLINGRLGEIVTTKRVKFNVKSTPGGTITSVVMQTNFEQGEGTETYTFSGSGEDMRLEGWNVNSNRLMITAAELEQLNTSQDESEAAN